MIAIKKNIDCPECIQNLGYSPELMVLKTCGTAKYLECPTCGYVTGAYNLKMVG